MKVFKHRPLSGKDDVASKPSTRNFLVAAGTMIVVFSVAIARYLWFFTHAVGADDKSRTMVFLVDGAFFSVPLVLGLLVAWVGLLKARKEKLNCKPPLTFD